MFDKIATYINGREPVSLFQEAMLVEGTLYVNLGVSHDHAGATLTQNGTPILMTPLSHNGGDACALPFEKAFLLSEAPQNILETTDAGDVVECGSECSVNALDDWALPGGKTAQIQVGERETPRIISLRHEISLPTSDGEKRFQTLFAAHRAAVSLEIRFSSPDWEAPVTEIIDHDPSFYGGKDRNFYQEVSVDVPQGESITVSLHIHYKGFLPDTVDHPPFIFLANPRVRGEGALNPLLEPMRIAGKQSNEGEWWIAKVPLFKSEHDCSFELTTGAKSIQLFAPELNTVELVENWGHMLSVRARNPQLALLYIDGEIVSAIEIQNEPTPIRIPTKYLRGEPVEVSVRSRSGSQVFLSEKIVPPRALTPADVLLSESRPPFPTDLTVRANHRYKALRAHLANPVSGMDLASLNIAFQALDRDHNTVTLEPICFPKVSNPVISIIIPAHNQVRATYYCLCALLAAHNATPFEVIVVDDGSSDEMAQLEEIVSNITVSRNEEPQRFIRACNAGAAKAKGKYVVFLNNDTEPTVGWLDELASTFDRFKNVGAAGSKLIYPDGVLQDAGGIIWRSGNPWNYGNMANPWEPRFCYARQVDYLSGAALMTRKDVWDQVGGFSSYLEPMYFEDTDFAFKVREAGYKTMFAPSSIVYHFEGTTSGTDTEAGFKRYQEVNRPKFKQRWAKTFTQFGAEAQEPDLEKDRGIIGRVLFIDHETPREDRDAGSYAAMREIELVQSMGFKVTFIPTNLAHLGTYTEDLQKRGVEVLYAPFALSIEDFLRERGAEFDAIYITRYNVAQQAIGSARKFAPQAKIILNSADLHFLRELRAAVAKDDPQALAAMRASRTQELDVMVKADLVLSYNEVERSIIATHTEGRAKVMTCPWVVTVPKHMPNVSQRNGLSFIGNFNHPPNTEGITWFCENVMPSLDREVRLSIYGSGMGNSIKALARENIDPVGFIENTSDAYDQHRVFIAPLLSGAGIKGKVMSALAHGIPTVLSPIAAEGIGLRNGQDCMIAEKPEEWIDAIVRLMTDDAVWQSISAAAQQYVKDTYSFALGRKKMRAIFEAVDIFRALPE